MAKQTNNIASISSVALLQHEALHILSQLDKKPIIAIDLDYTLWPALCADHTVGPYKPCYTKEINTRGSSIEKLNSLYCTDKRNSSVRLLSLYPEAREVLEWCLDNNIVLTVCSRCPDQPIVQEILTAFEMWDWFFLPQVFPQRKVNHFCNLVEQGKLEFTDFLFFDDDAANISLCSQMGVSSYQVRKSTGISWSSFVKGLTLYRNNEQARLTLKSWLNSSRSQQNSVDLSVTQNSSCYTTDNDADFIENNRKKMKHEDLEISPDREA